MRLFIHLLHLAAAADVHVLFTVAMILFCTEANCNICVSQQPIINVEASICA